MSEFSILVIDDEPNNFESIEVLLSKENYTTYYSSSGKEALTALHVFKPDLILLDVMMPEMDGLEVCKQLKLMREWRSVPIIMLTALSGDTVIEQCLQAGADDFINKPVRGTELRARIKSMLRIKKQFDRIESFTRLQHNKITSLEQNLVELGADLAVGFACEIFDPLQNIIKRFSDLSKKIDAVNQPELINLIDSGQQSTLELERLTNKFLLYMEFILEKKQFNSGETCNIKTTIEKIAEFRLQDFQQVYNFKIDVANIELAMSTQHCEWIVKELLDDIIHFSQSDNPVMISGWIVEKSFHLLMSNGTNPDQDLRSTQDPDLALSLKMVKKIVDIYDGQFSLSNTNLHDRTVHITLPVR